MNFDEEDQYGIKFLCRWIGYGGLVMSIIIGLLCYTNLICDIEFLFAIFFLKKGVDRFLG